MSYYIPSGSEKVTYDRAGTTGGNGIDGITIALIVAIVIVACIVASFIAVAELTGKKTQMDDSQQLQAEIQATAYAVINDARDREMDGAVRLAEAVSGNGGTFGTPSGSNDVIVILALTGTILFMGLILFALAKRQ